MTIEENVLLAAYTTFRLGGAARYFVRVQNLEELQEALSFAKERALRVLILGGGSNMLVADKGFDGLVLRIDIVGMEREGDTYVVGAGESWDSFVARTVDDGFWGVENLSGIPGSVGAAPIQNIGAYGAEVKDTLVWVEAFDTHSCKVVRLQASECGFGYRTSRFKKEPGRYVLLRAAFTLSAEPKPNLSYKDLAETFAGNPAPGLANIRSALLAIRGRKFPDLAFEGTAGSFFLNPVVTKEKASELRTLYPALPQYEAPGGVKIALAWLLDNALQIKGLQVGAARLFERQPLVIVAARGASAKDVHALAEAVKKIVKENVGIELEEEVRTIS